jgi:hypothetical protein
VFRAPCGWQKLSKLGDPAFIVCKGTPGTLATPRRLADRVKQMKARIVISTRTHHPNMERHFGNKLRRELSRWHPRSKTSAARILTMHCLRTLSGLCKQQRKTSCASNNFYEYEHRSFLSRPGALPRPTALKGSCCLGTTHQDLFASFGTISNPRHRPSSGQESHCTDCQQGHMFHSCEVIPAFRPFLTAE